MRDAHLIGHTFIFIALTALHFPIINSYHCFTSLNIDLSLKSSLPQHQTIIIPSHSPVHILILTLKNNPNNLATVLTKSYWNWPNTDQTHHQNVWPSWKAHVTVEWPASDAESDCQGRTKRYIITLPLHFLIRFNKKNYSCSVQVGLINVMTSYLIC